MTSSRTRAESTVLRLPAAIVGYCRLGMPRPLPVLLIAFNRPDLAQSTAQQIAAYRPAAVFLACDGPRDANEKAVVDETRDVVIRALGDEMPVFTLLRDDNLGCKRSVEDAITWFFEHVDEGVILEDDCVPSRTFFEFCEQMLDRYRDDYRVMHVSGYYGGNPAPGTYLFSQYPRVWGWATWRRAWALHNSSEPLSLNCDAVERSFGSSEQARYFLSKLDEVQKCNLDTWDFGWVTTVVTNRALAIQPLLNLVTNTGVGDARAAHTTRSHLNVSANLAVEFRGPWQGPPRVSPDFAYDKRTFRREIASPSARLRSSLPPRLRPVIVSLRRRIQARWNLLRQ
jgi:hypothetical protein